jgi:hypothetical protein
MLVPNVVFLYFLAFIGLLKGHRWVVTERGCNLQYCDIAIDGVKVTITARNASSVRLELNETTFLLDVDTDGASVLRQAHDVSLSPVVRTFKQDERIIVVLPLFRGDEAFADLVAAYIKSSSFIEAPSLTNTLSKESKHACNRISLLRANAVAIIELRLILEGTPEGLANWPSVPMVGLGLESISRSKVEKKVRMRSGNYIFEYDRKSGTFKDLGAPGVKSYPIVDNILMPGRQVVMVPRWGSKCAPKLWATAERGFGNVAEATFLYILSRLRHADEYIILLLPHNKVNQATR